MAYLKSFDQFISDKQVYRDEEIEAQISLEETPDIKTPEETEEEIEDVKQDDIVEESEETEEEVEETEEEVEETEEEVEETEEEPLMVSELLKECYESVKNEAKVWADDAHDEHTIETYMKENVALVAGLAASALSEMKGELATEAYEAALNQMVESFTKKINECKESSESPDAGAVE